MKREEAKESAVPQSLYLAYGSNMNRAQMAFRCPDAEMVGNVKIEGYRLAFRYSGVATLLPEPGGAVDGVLWRISQEDEERLNRYEGYPVLYGRDSITVKTADGRSVQAMVYLMNAPYRDTPAMPPRNYIIGIYSACLENGIDVVPVLKAVKRTEKEIPEKSPPKKRRGQER